MHENLFNLKAHDEVFRKMAISTEEQYLKSLPVETFQERADMIRSYVGDILEMVYEEYARRGVRINTKLVEWRNQHKDFKDTGAQKALLGMAIDMINSKSFSDNTDNVRLLTEMTQAIRGFNKRISGPDAL